MLPTLTATRYLTPLREGGSLPAVVDTAEDGLWVVKFRGSGQGARALIAEIVVGLLARELGLPVPDMSIVSIDPSFGRTEPDPEIQDILMGSHGLNVGLRYMDGAFNFDLKAAAELIPPALPTALVWLDALVFNPDRTHRNPNLLIWRRQPYLIDHGAALYFHHAWARMTPDRARAPFPRILDHLFLEGAHDVEQVDQDLAERLPPRRIEAILDSIPDALLADPVSGEPEVDPSEVRQRYLHVFRERLQEPRAWVAGIAEAHRERRATPIRRMESRR